MSRSQPELRCQLYEEILAPILLRNIPTLRRNIPTLRRNVGTNQFNSGYAETKFERLIRKEIHFRIVTVKTPY